MLLLLPGSVAGPAGLDALQTGWLVLVAFVALLAPVVRVTRWLYRRQHAIDTHVRRYGADIPLNQQMANLAALDMEMDKGPML